MPTATNSTAKLADRLVNGVLAIKPLANLAKHQARQMMIKRAASIGVDWPKEVENLKNQDLEAELKQVQNHQLQYPAYYLTSFHAYEAGNLSWEAATEVEVAAYAVHARIWPNAGAQGDAQLRQSYHKVLLQEIPTPPQQILDIGCSVGMSTFALQEAYPAAELTGLDLSPYFLAIANYQSRQPQRSQYKPVRWLHAAGEATGLPEASFDLVSICLVYHELPQTAALEILQEARRLLKPNGYIAIMDMNPQSEVYASMPTYIRTLLKSTEPYLNEYFDLDIAQAIANAGFTQPKITCNTPRHRTILAKAI